MRTRGPDPADVPENRLLATLPRPEYDRLVARTDAVAFDYPEVLYRPNAAMHYVYFVRGGVLSMVIDTEDGGTVEVGTVGYEGLAGLPVALGDDRSPVRVYCQVPPCHCRRMSADAFREEMRREGPFRAAVLRFAQFTMIHQSQSIACGRLHQVEQRFARWLLMTHDRIGGDEFRLTQQVASEMLGVRRPSVSVAAAALQKAGLIRYTRGKLTVLDRAGLEKASCECYRGVRAERERLLP